MFENSAIRKAILVDVDVIHHLLDMDPFKYNDEMPFDREWIVKLVCDERCLTLVYETEGIIKGFISGEKLVSGAILLWFCAVKKEHQHGIIGARLYFEFEKYCRSIGVNAILAYGFKTSAKMLDRMDFYSNDNTYKEFYKPLDQQVEWD